MNFKFNFTCDRSIWEILCVVSYLILPIKSTLTSINTNLASSSSIKTHKFANGSHLITYVAQQKQPSPVVEQKFVHNSTLKSILSFPNHRMDSSSTFDSNSSTANNNHDHRLAVDSILRPQLALQIFTHPIPQSTSVESGKFDQNQSNNQQSNLNNKISSANERRVGGNNAHSRSVDYHNDRSQLMEGSSSNNWRYETSADQRSQQQQPHQQDIISSRNGYSANDDQNFASNSNDNHHDNSGPLINAIITVPATSGSDHEHVHKDDNHHHHHHHNYHQQYNHRRHPRHNSNQRHSSPTTSSSDNQNQPANLEDTITQVNGVDQVISKIIDSQANGNLEFSMNLNGDEIIINPLNKNNIAFNLANSSKDSAADDLYSDADDLRVQSKSYLRRPRDELAGDQGFMSKALRKHVASELAGDEQSASEMDVGQSNEDADRDSELDNSSVLNESNNGDDDDESSTKPKLKDIDAEIEKEKRNGPHKSWVVSTTSSNLAPDATGGSLNDEAKDIEPRPTKSRTTSSRGRDSNQDLNLAEKRTRARKSSSRLSQRNKDKDSVESNPSSNLRKAGSKRRLTFRATSGSGYPSDSQDDKSERFSGGKPSSSNTVTINGEDVRKFEQLLEEMRSLSLNNLNQAKAAKRLSKSPSSRVSTSRQPTVNEEEQDTYGRGEEDSGVGSGGGNGGNNQLFSEDIAGSRAQGGGHMRGATKRLTKSSDPPTDIPNDCDRKAKQKSLQKSATDDLESQMPPSSDATVSLVDKDSSFDGESSSDEMNDEGSQNVEQQEAPSSSARRKNFTSADDKPKTVYVRKTVLQDYYDNNNSNNGNNQVANEVIENSTGGDDLESVHRSQHEAQHERQTSPDDSKFRSQQQTQARQSQPLNSYNNLGLDELNSHRQVAETPSPLNNYIDYSNLDDRDVYRGSESQKFKVLIPQREQLDRMRTLQQAIERVATEQSEKNRRV